MEKSSKILVGKEEICCFAGFGKMMWKEMIHKGFPAVYWGGKWRAHADNINKWAQAMTMPRGPQQDKEEEA